MLGLFFYLPLSFWLQYIDITLRSMFNQKGGAKKQLSKPKP
jgi:hypothetical protein